MTFKASVTVADQERYWREMARAALEQDGYRVNLASNDIDLRRALAARPDVIVLGFPAVRQVEEDLVRYTLETCPDAIVLVISTSWPVPLAIERRLLRMGVADIIGRLGNGRDLVRIIENELNERRDELASSSSYGRFRLRGAE